MNRPFIQRGRHALEVSWDSVGRRIEPEVNRGLARHMAAGLDVVTAIDVSGPRRSPTGPDCTFKWTSVIPVMRGKTEWQR